MVFKAHHARMKHQLSGVVRIPAKSELISHTHREKTSNIIETNIFFGLASPCIEKRYPLPKSQIRISAALSSQKKEGVSLAAKFAASSSAIS